MFPTPWRQAIDKQESNAIAVELVNCLKTESDLNLFLYMLTKCTVKDELSAELTEHLGHENT